MEIAAKEMAQETEKFPLLVDPFTGQTFSHYQMMKQIRESGMGTVYKANDTRLVQLIALREGRIPPYYARTRGIINRRGGHFAKILPDRFPGVVYGLVWRAMTLLCYFET